MSDATQILSLPARKIVFGAYFLLLLAMALYPPFYLSVSGSTTLVAGIPLPIFYWMSTAVLAGLGVWALYMIESINGELPEEGNSHD
jgi:hypothetical protein